MGVIRNDTKSSVGCIFFHDTTKRHLSCRRHSIRFIEDDQLECPKRWVRTGRRSYRKYLLCAFRAISMTSHDRCLGKGNRLANVLICSRTTSIPLSSLAFSSKTICRIFLVPYIRRANARIVDVLPVPGGPYSKRCGSLYPLFLVYSSSMHSPQIPSLSYFRVNKSIDR